MPLLGDSKSVYVGNTPITKVMAGDVQVWPKGPPVPDPPEFSQVGMRFPANRSVVFYPVSWDVEQGSCDDLKKYEVRYGWSPGYPDGDGSTPPTTWQSWEDLWTELWTVFDPTNKKIYWANAYAEKDYNGLGKFTWAEVREKVSQETVVPPVQTDTDAAEIPYPVGGVQCSTVDLPGHYPPSQHVAWYHFDDDLTSESAGPTLNSQGNIGYEFVDSPWGKCVTSSGSSGRQMYLDGILFGQSRPYTIEAWLNVSPPYGLSKNPSVFIGYESYEFEDDGNADLNTLSFKVDVASGIVRARSGFIPKKTINVNELVLNFAEAGVETGKWFHVAASCSVDGTELRMYVNGKYKGTDTNVGFDPRFPFKWIKVRALTDYNQAPAKIDELRLSKEIFYPDSDITP